MSLGDELVYQVVIPGDPDENGRSCLNGVGVGVPVGFATVEMGARVSEARWSIGSEVVGPLVPTGGVLKRLKLDVSDGVPIARRLWTHLGP